MLAFGTVQWEVFLNVLFDTVKFVCHSQNSFLASRQTPVTIEMLLPITRIEVGVGNRVATVQHHGIAHINADVGNAGGVVGADEKYKVAGLGLILGLWITDIHIVRGAEEHAQNF